MQLLILSVFRLRAWFMSLCIEIPLLSYCDSSRRRKVARPSTGSGEKVGLFIAAPGNLRPATKRRLAKLVFSSCV